MSSKNEDIRSRRTRKQLRQALIDLTAEIGYDAVTVTELAERAMINRATFYRYYEDKEDLLFRGMYEFFDSFVADAGPPSDRSSKSLVESLIHIRDNRDFYRVMLGPKGVAAFQDRVWRYHLEIAGRRLPQLLQGSVGTDIQILKGLVAGALGGIVRVWLEEGCITEPEALAKKLFQLVSAGIAPFQENRLPPG